jgi:sec-independent protein translocase protein TatC
MFIGILLGLGVVFQMPIVIFILTALRIASPKFLMENVRYAILIIFVLAAVITPTPDIFNMITFAAPMILLFYVGIFVSYLFLLKREGKSLPWGKMLLVVLIVLALIAGLMYYLCSEMGYRFVTEFPWFVGPIG